MILKKYTSKLEVAKSFSEYLSQQIASEETFHIALSGGSTPKVIFDELVSNFKNDIDWSGVHLYWGDERCVPPTDSESNYKMTVDHLISKIDIPETNIHRVQGEDNPQEEAVRYGDLLNEMLPKSNQLPQFDLVILGMGDDGHTASIFPHEIDLWQSEKYCEVAIHPDSGQRRVTITGNVINEAKTVAFLVTGENKADKLDEILNKQGSFETYPASLVAPVSGELLWFLDADAAKHIN